MNGEVEIFENEEFGKIRTVNIDGEPWFVAKDVCDILGVKNPRQAMTRLDDFEKNTVILNDGNKGNPNMTIISESGFYILVLSSRKPIAKPFQIWVTREVLPSIRKTGSYTANPSNKMELALDDMKVVYAQINNMEDLLAEQNEKLDRVVDNLTLSTRQQQKIYKVAKDRVNHLLGGAHSKEYKANSRSYFINMWNGLKSKFQCGSYKDLNPIYFDKAVEFISGWEYVENQEGETIACI